MPVALIVLLLVFGAVLAAFMPLVLSIISILLAVALTGADRPGLPDEHLRARTSSP